MRYLILIILAAVTFAACQKYEPVDDWRPVTPVIYGAPKYIVNVPCESTLTDNYGKPSNSSGVNFGYFDEYNYSSYYKVIASSVNGYPSINIQWDYNTRPKVDTILDISRSDVSMYLDYNWTYEDYHTGKIYVNVRNDSLIFSVCQAQGTNATFSGRFKFKYQ